MTSKTLSWSGFVLKSPMHQCTGLHVVLQEPPQAVPDARGDSHVFIGWSLEQ